MRPTLLLLLALCLAGCGRSAEAWTAEGDALLRANKLADAERAYNRALARDPHHAPAAYGKGWALYAAGHDELRAASRQLFERAIDYDPEFFGGYRGKGVLLLEEGQLLVAERLLRQAWAKAPNDPATLESLGQLYLSSGRFEDAETMFRAAVTSSPGRGELQRFVADALASQGDLDGARDALLVGLGSSISGVRGLVLLQEGQVGLELRVAEEATRDAINADDERLALALQALDRADTVLQEARAHGVFVVELQELVVRAARARRELERKRQPDTQGEGERIKP